MPGEGCLYRGTYLCAVFMGCRALHDALKPWFGGPKFLSDLINRIGREFGTLAPLASLLKTLGTHQLPSPVQAVLCLMIYKPTASCTPPFVLHTASLAVEMWVGVVWWSFL